MLNQETVDKLTTPVTKQKRSGCLPGPDFLQGYQDEVGRRSGVVRLHERVRGWQGKLKTQGMLQHPQPVNMSWPQIILNERGHNGGTQLKARPGTGTDLESCSER